MHTWDDETQKYSKQLRIFFKTYSIKHALNKKYFNKIGFPVANFKSAANLFETDLKQFF